jgi:hypothetical protein
VTIDALERALVEAGIKFANGDAPGVRLKKENRQQRSPRKSRVALARCTIFSIVAVGDGTGPGTPAATVAKQT